MYEKTSNHPFVVWGVCFLWLISIFIITWSLLLFSYVGDLLLSTGTNLVNAVSLLSGILMLPSNVHMMYSIAHYQKINHRSKVICCPLWISMLCIIIVNCVGVGLCLQRIYIGEAFTLVLFFKSMKNYKMESRNKNVVDNVQWSLNCCGDSLLSEIDVETFLMNRSCILTKIGLNKIGMTKYIGECSLPMTTFNEPRTVNKGHKDSVPLSCCKSGSCIPSYLMELGTDSINTPGCGQSLHRIVFISMMAHLVLFLTITLLEVSILVMITKQDRKCTKNREKLTVKNIMSVNDNFATVSPSSATTEIGENNFFY